MDLEDSLPEQVPALTWVGAEAGIIGRIKRFDVR